MTDDPPEPARTSAPASMKEFLLLLAILAVVATLAFFLLGDSVSRWLPQK